MLSLLAAAGAATDPIYWANLGLTEGIDLGFFTLRYYSLAYLLGVLFAYWHVTKMIKQPGAPMAQRHVDDLFFYCTLGVILGGRLGYAAFYRPELFTSFNGEGFVSWDLLRLWDGGMSFHGGLLGVMAAMMWVSWRGKLSFLRVTDYVSVGVPMGMLLGRLANFTNGELWGRATDVSWGMIFPGGGDVVRHPSQLYQLALEGVVLFVALWLFSSKPRRRGQVTGLFLLGYGLFRFMVEFVREPDSHLGFIALNWMTMGQLLTLPMIAIGVWLLLIRKESSDARIS